MKNKKAQSEIYIFPILLAGFLIFLAIGMFVWPKYKVWAKELNGKAELKEAEWNRQIAVEEAQAKKASAKLLAEAEIERAKGVAAANEIIAQSLDEQYLRYLWIQGLNDGTSEVIYVPTEANLPLLEARNK